MEIKISERSKKLFKEAPEILELFAAIPRFGFGAYKEIFTQLPFVPFTYSRMLREEYKGARGKVLSVFILAAPFLLAGMVSLIDRSPQTAFYALGLGWFAESAVLGPLTEKSL